MSMEALAMAGADYQECNIDLHLWERRQNLDPPPPHLRVSLGRSRSLPVNFKKNGNRSRLRNVSSSRYICKKADFDHVESNPATSRQNPTPLSPYSSNEDQEAEDGSLESLGWKRVWFKIFCSNGLFRCFS